MANLQDNLTLNPGAPKRRPASGWKCFLWSSFVCLILVASLLLYFVPWKAFMKLKSPHAYVYQNATMEEVLDRSSVIQPLINESDTFDIVASVWVRDGPIPEGNELFREKLVFSDVVFRGATLKDKGLMTEVNFQVPTSIFKDSRTLTSYDLRGSFSLVPSSTTLLDNVVGFSSWIPHAIRLPPVQAQIAEHLTLRNEVIEQYGIHVPLVEFYPMASRCADSDGGEISSSDEEEKKGDNSPFLFRTNDNLTTLDGHPYLVTRSHLRVVDFTRVLNVEKFTRAQERFSQISCKKGIQDALPSWRYCLRNDKFTGEGFWKTTILKLGIPESSSGENKTEWAYSPYLSAVKNARGPLDLVPVPVNKEECKDVSTPDEDVVHLKWKITYSGRAPAKMWLGDQTDAFTLHANMSNPEQLKHGQVYSEVQHGLYGHRHSKGTHPRWYFGKIIFGVIGSGTAKILKLLYWYTRASTVGISSSGIILNAAAEAIETVYIGISNATVSSKVPNPSLWLYLWIILVTIGPFWVVLNLLKMKVMMRLQIQWTGTIPKVKMHPATHAERTSRRVDAKLSRMVICLGTLAFAILYLYIDRHDRDPVYDSRDYSTILTWGLIDSMHLMGSVAQIMLNRRSRTFASMYRTTAIIGLFISVLGFLPPHLLLSVDSDAYVRGYSYQSYVSTCAQIVIAYQALRYPYVSYNAEDED